MVDEIKRLSSTKGQDSIHAWKKV